eukprot:2617406-Pyramimonas_sp.AAC.1
MCCSQWTQFFYAVVSAGVQWQPSKEASATMVLPLAQLPAKRQALACASMLKFSVAHREAPSMLRCDRRSQVLVLGGTPRCPLDAQMRYHAQDL